MYNYIQSNMTSISTIKQEPASPIQRAPSPVERKDRRCSLFRIITGASVAALAVLVSFGGAIPQNRATVQTSPALRVPNQICKLEPYPTPTPFEGAPSTFCMEEEDPALVEKRQLESRYRKLPCPPQMKKILAYTTVAGGRGDIAASAKAVNLMRTICPNATIEWVLGCDSDCRKEGYDPRAFLNPNDPSIQFRYLDADPPDETPIDFTLVGPYPPSCRFTEFERKLDRKIAGPVFGFVENANNPRWEPSFLAMGLKAGTGVFLDRSRIEAPLSREYCCPSYLPKIEDDGLRKDILEAMNVFDGQSQPDYDQYSFNSGYAHREASWEKFIDSVAIHEQKKDVVIVLNQRSALTRYRKGGSRDTEFRDKILTPDRLAFLKEKGYGTVILRGGKGEPPVLLQEAKNPESERRLTVIVRPSFLPNDMKRMQLASERLLATGDNSAAEAWAAQCKLYLYEDVSNAGGKWKFLRQQVDLARAISPNLAELLALFGGDDRFADNPLNKPLDKTRMERLERLLSDPDLGNATLKFCNKIVNEYSFEEILEGQVKRVAWKHYDPSKSPPSP